MKDEELAKCQGSEVLWAEELKHVERALQERCNAGLAFQWDHLWTEAVVRGKLEVTEGWVGYR